MGLVTARLERAPTLCSSVEECVPPCGSKIRAQSSVATCFAGERCPAHSAELKSKLQNSIRLFVLKMQPRKVVLETHGHVLHLEQSSWLLLSVLRCSPVRQVARPAEGPAPATLRARVDLRPCTLNFLLS